MSTFAFVEYAVINAQFACRPLVLFPRIGFVRPDAFLVAAQQILHLLRVMHVGRCKCAFANDLAFDIKNDANFLIRDIRVIRG